jgi:hypothetical protein
MLRAAIAIVLTTVCAYAQAPYPQVLRCVDADGNVEYRASPCPADAREQVVGAQNATAETNADTNKGVTSPGISRRAYLSAERKQALDVAERYAAVARAARPQVQVQVLPPAAGK